MIKEIELNNFKCFQRSKPFSFSKLNLLTGINGRGKSSLLQSILVLSQSAWRNNDLKKLIINDELVSLGNYDDIKNSETPRSENIHLNFKFDSPFIDEIKLQYNENPDEALVANCEVIEVFSQGKSIRVEPQKKQNDDAIQLFAEIIKRTHFVSADRLGPVKYVDKFNLPEFVHVGPKGEHTINILANSIKLSNVNDILYLGSDAKSVIQQTIEWMSYILDGAKIDIGGKGKESSVLYMLLNNKSNSYSYKPANVGFGYSYILPLIVTGLIAKPGEIIIIENPEAHLHPRAQSKIAEYFSRVASCGIQVFIESHSEHILNGLRVSALDPSIKINYDELAIHYFSESFDAVNLKMDSKGKIPNWPYGFFDQQELDLAEIFKYSRQS
jgi:predicted ATPase